MVQTHYDVEDVPAGDADTQVQLFEQAAEAASGGVEVAQRMRAEAEAVLGVIFHEADQAGNTALAARVNDVWDQVQTLTTVAQRQGAALKGANGAITELKEQRDRVIEELEGIRAALDEMDEDHPELADFVENMQEYWEDSSKYYWEDYSYEVAYENITESMAATLKANAGIGSHEATEILDLLLYHGKKLTAEQVDLLQKLAATFSAPEKPKQG